MKVKGKILQVVREAYREVKKAFLAPKQEARFRVEAYGDLGWAVLDKRKDSLVICYECPSQPMEECEKHARRICAMLNCER